MDDIVRPRYPRSRSGKSRRKNKDGLEFRQKFALQFIVCLIMLGMIMGMKNIDKPFANYTVAGVKQILSDNIDLSSVYKKIDEVLKDDSGQKKQSDTKKSGSEEPAVSASSQPEVGLTGEGEYGEGSQMLKDGSGSSGDDSGDNSNAEATTQGAVIKDNTTTQGAVKSSETNPKKSFIIPVSGLVGSPFGQRIHPIKKTVESHKGVDIEAKNGDSIKAVLDGEVIEAGMEKTYGNYLKIKHQNNITTIYAHCSALLVKKGQKVKQGAVIAKVGNTGLSIGAHLHFEVWKNDKAVDPLTYVKLPLKKQNNSTK